LISVLRLLGQSPTNPAITITELQQAIKHCGHLQFIGDKIPHPLKVMAKPMLKPIDKLTLLPVNDRNKDQQEPLYLLGIASNAPIETWQHISELLVQLAESGHRKIMLRILAWGAEAEQLPLELGLNNPVEIIRIFEKPGDLSLIADLGLVMSPESNDNLALEFLRSGISVITIDELISSGGNIITKILPSFSSK
jgi:hypothetical protein